MEDTQNTEVKTEERRCTGSALNDLLYCRNFKSFRNGIVYLLYTEDGYPIETTDTFLPYYTKDAIGKKQNKLISKDAGSRKERWMIGVSVMSGCPVDCKFCATGKLDKWRKLTAGEMVAQVKYIVEQNSNISPLDSKEFKINWTRMGEPFLNITEVKKAIKVISDKYPNTHHYISTIGIKGADYSWIEGNITLQFSVHSFDEDYRNWLIPFKGKVKLEEMGIVETASNLKTTLNLTMVRKEDFSITEMQRIFDKDKFFVKISPINENDVSIANEMGSGIIEQQNLI
ncbi:MAG: radical SAM protein [Desulfocapsa sp.]|nr:radical SAM protein [Desulfocapsa sp.]